MLLRDKLPSGFEAHTEMWAPILSLQTRYFASTRGRIAHKKRIFKPLKPHVQQSGYKVVHLQDLGCPRVHRLILEAFGYTR